MKKTFLLTALAVLLPALPLCAGDGASRPVFKPYGFVRTYSIFDSRESSCGTQDLYYFCPKDELPGKDGKDLNALPSWKMVALSSRIGVDISGFRYGGMALSAKIEADFYNMNKSTAVLRLRQAFVTMRWKELWNRERYSLSLSVGQKWHPMAVDMPNVVSLETGAPFNPFNRSPQLTATLGLGGHFALTGSLLYQMQYLSTGPAGKSQDYLKHSCIPEMYAGVEFADGGLSAKLGVDLLNIRPRTKAGDVKVSERLLTVSPFAYLKYTAGAFAIDAKTILAEAGEHLNLLTGYGVSGQQADGSREYTPMRSTASYLSMKYGKKLQFMMMAGYMKLLGTKDRLEVEFYHNASGAANLCQSFRLTPTVAWNWGKLTLALEYNLTRTQFGSLSEHRFGADDRGVATEGLHWVTNHRVLTMLKYSF